MPMFHNVYLDEFGTQFVGAGWGSREDANSAAAYHARKWRDTRILLIRVRLKVHA